MKTKNLARFVSVLVGAAMAVTAFATVASADAVYTPITPTKLLTELNQWPAMASSNVTADNVSDGQFGLDWNAQTNTLTLYNGFNYVGKTTITDKGILTLPAGSTIDVEATNPQGAKTLGYASITTNSPDFAIYCAGDLTINGDGTLIITDTSTSKTAVSFGVYAVGNLTIGSSVTIKSDLSAKGNVNSAAFACSGPGAMTIQGTSRVTEINVWGTQVLGDDSGAQMCTNKNTAIKTSDIATNFSTVGDYKGYAAWEAVIQPWSPNAVVLPDDTSVALGSTLDLSTVISNPLNQVYTVALNPTKDPAQVDNLKPQSGTVTAAQPYGSSVRYVLQSSPVATDNDNGGNTVLDMTSSLAGGSVMPQILDPAKPAAVGYDVTNHAGAANAKADIVKLGTTAIPAYWADNNIPIGCVSTTGYLEVNVTPMMLNYNLMGGTAVMATGYTNAGVTVGGTISEPIYQVGAQPVTNTVIDNQIYNNGSPKNYASASAVGAVNGGYPIATTKAYGANKNDTTLTKPGYIFMGWSTVDLSNDPGAANGPTDVPSYSGLYVVGADGSYYKQTGTALTQVTGEQQVYGVAGPTSGYTSIAPGATGASKFDLNDYLTGTDSTKYPTTLYAVWKATGAVTISGASKIILKGGYLSTGVGPYVVTGDPNTTTVAFTDASTNMPQIAAKLSYDPTNQVITVQSGIPLGTYNVTMTATSSVSGTVATAPITIVVQNSGTMTPGTFRLAGPDRYGTAVAVANAGWTSANTVFLATGLTYPDALAAVPLAAAMNAPILLTTAGTTPASTLAEMKTLGATNVVLLGGTGTISQAQQNTLTTAGYTVTRIGGADRYQTAALIGQALEQASNSSIAFMTAGQNSADALSAGPVAALCGAPIVFADATMPAQTQQFLLANNISTVVIIGGPGSVSAAVANQLTGMGITVQRCSGTDRYDTSGNVAITFASLFNLSQATVASGATNAFPDALCGGVFAALGQAPVLLIDPVNGASQSEKTFVATQGVTTIAIFGGTGTLSDAAANSVLPN